MALERITTKKLVNDLSNLLNLKRGIPFTIWQLIKNPSKAIHTYLTKDRNNFVNSFRMLSLLVAIYTFMAVHFGFLDNLDINFKITTEDKTKSKEITEMAVAAFEEYSSYLGFLMIPIVAFFTYIFFRKSGYNYAEQTTAQAYLMGLSTGISILLFPLSYWNAQFYAFLILLLLVAYHIWYCMKLPSQKNLFRRISASTLSFVIGYVLFNLMLFMAIGVIVGFKYASQHP